MLIAFIHDYTYTYKGYRPNLNRNAIFITAYRPTYARQSVVFTDLKFNFLIFSLQLYYDVV